MERNFNSFNIKRKNSLRCGTIIFNRDCTKVITVLNRHSYNMGENKWGFPKGGIQRDEKFVNCAMRETLEETGLNIKIRSDAAVLKISKTRYFPIILDETKCTRFNPTDKHEIYDVKWHTIERLQKFKALHTNHELKRFLTNTNISRAIRIAKNNVVTLMN